MRYTPRAVLFCLGLILASPVTLTAEYQLESPFTFSFLHRFRVEMHDNAIGMNAVSSDSYTYTRHKSSLGILWKGLPNVEVFTKISNEFRVYLAPRERKGNNELFVDNLYLKWTQQSGIPFTMTVGRQDMNFGEGFVIMEGQAGDGSRSFYFNALRVDLTPFENHNFTLFYSYVPRTDNILPVIKLRKADDQLLEEQNKTSFGLYYSGVFSFAKIDAYLIRKDTQQNEWWTNELHSNTFGARVVGRISDPLNFTLEAAVQSGHIEETAAAGSPTRDMKGFGGLAHLDYNFLEETIFFRTVSFGGFFLSGDDPATTDRVESWDPVHSRWPKWSDSYIYALIPETGVANWSNLNAIYLSLTGSIYEALSASFAYYTLGAQHAIPNKPFPGGAGKSRGSLAIAKLLMTFNKNLSGHFIWEHFIPGNFYFPDAQSYNWLRFEMLLKM